MLRVRSDGVNHWLPNSIAGVLKYVYGVLVLLVLALLMCFLYLLACIKADICAYGLGLFLYERTCFLILIWKRHHY
jgi:hypothetical protein